MGSVANPTYQKNGEIWYYNIGMTMAEKRGNKETFNINGGSLIPLSLRFSDNGNWIVYDLQHSLELPKPSQNVVPVNIWSYKDSVIQPEQRRRLEIGENIQTTAIINSNGGKAIQVVNKNEINRTYKFCCDFIVVTDNRDVPVWWKLSAQPSYYVVSLTDGHRRLLKNGGAILRQFSFSPDGKWLIYYDEKEAAFFSFDIATGVISNITKDIPTNFQSEYDGTVFKSPVSGVAGWLSNEEGFLLYDHYDIWKVDPSGKKKALNITNGYGQKHGLKLRLIDGAESSNPKEVFTSKESQLITAFSSDTKFNGFYRKNLAKIGDPELLYVGPYVFYRTRSQKIHSFGEPSIKPVKAANSDVWIVRRQSAVDAPNYYVTKDFKSFKALTNLQPQKDYNWLTSELITWKQFDGSMSQGVLYKPENFDSAKKYPVLFNYYEKMSHTLYEFKEPGFATDNINIPWFVSRGYLVFMPDIHYQIGSLSGKTVGEWAYNSVVSAAEHLGRLPYVDAKRMGIQGHSFGGLETGYIVTHTNLFAAAIEAAGNTDPISAYLTLTPFASRSIEHSERFEIAENGHELYGATPWERPDLYQINSAVLSADKVTTPILIMHNELDNNIAWRQGVEFYMALRRLGKKSWMLQYDGEGHVVEGKSAIDYTIRMTQFFDHYLKGEIPPKWMTEGISYKLKGVETGYEPDATGKIP